MTTIEHSAESAAGVGVNSRLLAIVDTFTSTDHKKIGQLFCAVGLGGLLATVVVNLLLAVERLDGTDAALDSGSWVQLFDAQRVGLIFGAMLPLALGVYLVVVPLQLGARAIAFPRLAASGLYMWIGGLVLAIVAIANNGGAGGGRADMVDLYLAALGLMIVGLLAAAGSIATSVLTTRAPGMTMRRVPFFSFSALVFSLGLILALPVMLGGIVYLFLDHRNGRTGFGANQGIYEWIGWAMTQPTTYLFALPVVGLLAEMFPVTFRKRQPLRGVVFAGLALTGIAALAATTQQQIFNLPWAGSNLSIADGEDFSQKVQDLLPLLFFKGLPLLGVVMVLLLGLVLAKPDGSGNRPNLTAPFVFGFFGTGMLFVGMAGTLLYAVDDLALQGTVFEEGALIYVAYGAVLGALGAIAYWLPKVSGTALATAKVLPLALLGVLATVLASLPHYIAGFLDQPAGPVYDDGDLQIWNVLVLVGHGLMALTVLAFLGLVAQTVRSGDAAGDDPYDAHTLEWATTSPAPADNFVDLPVVNSGEPLLDLKGTNDTAGSDA